MAKSTAIRMVGVDVSAARLDVSRAAEDEAVARRQWPNTPRGQRALARWVTQGGRQARVVLEATGLYSLDVALTLQRPAGIAMLVINPRVSKDFAGAWGQRARTDATAAEGLREFAARMPFRPWTPPSEAALAVRAVMRRVGALIAMRVQERNRLHALSASGALPAVLRADLRQHIAALGQGHRAAQCVAHPERGGGAAP